MENKLCFVQFLHPGPEHQPDGGSFKSWNRSGHLRKFLKHTGRYVRDGRLAEGEIVFWSEWEPESEVVSEIQSPLDGGPRYIYRPFYVKPTSYPGLQNTDPFVFGERFYYTLCRQTSSRGTTQFPTQLRHLKRGSVILFGSCVRGGFALDTVFVVEDWIEHSRANFRARLADAIPEAYKDVTVAPCYQEPFDGANGCAPQNPSLPLRLYFGATYDNPLHGMFSFFPCLEYEKGVRGFARPRISMRGVIKDTHKQNYKLTLGDSLDDVKALWDEVVSQVEGQGLRLGVFTDIPEEAAGDGAEVRPLVRITRRRACG